MRGARVGACVCPGVRSCVCAEPRRPFEALSFPTVSFQRWCTPTGAVTSEAGANHRAEARVSDGAVGSIASQCASATQRGESYVKTCHSKGSGGGVGESIIL